MKTPKSLTRSADFPAILTDLDGYTLAASIPLTRLVARLESQLIGQRPGDILRDPATPFADRVRARQAVRRSIKRGQAAFIASNTLPNGTPYNAYVIIKRTGNYLLSSQICRARGYHMEFVTAEEKLNILLDQIESLTPQHSFAR